MIKNKYYIKINLSFFDDGDKTEAATSTKKKKARDEGQVAKSEEISTAFMLVGVFSALKVFSSGIYINTLKMFTYNFQLIGEINDIFNMDFIKRYITYMFLQIILIVAPVFLATMGIGILANIIQVGWHPTTKTLKPKPGNLNPLKGVKKLFSSKVIVDLIKSVAKMILVLYAMYNTVKEQKDAVFKILDMDLLEGVIYVSTIAVDMGINVGVMFIFIAAADFGYQKFKNIKDMKMTKQEVKEEHKMSEGNPQIKGAIRQKMREASMRRMMQDVPHADVIITNPTHFAVAIKYDLTKAQAPRVVGKGADHMALRIKEVAKENNIEIVENKMLARTLYSTVDIGKEIPEELYQSVAEILAFVYNIKNVV